MHTRTTLRAALLVLCAAAEPAAAAVSVRHDGSHWVLQAERAERAAVWQALAAASGSTLSVALAPQARPLTLRWRGTRLSDAWRRVLGDDVNHALQCQARSCRVWVLGSVPDAEPAPGQPAAVAARPPVRGRVGPRRAGTASDWSALTPDEVGDLRQPDPPGLFPDDEP